MATRGRKPKPTKLKQLEGNPGQRPLNTEEPKPDLASADGEPPAFLSKHAKAEWRRVYGPMRNCGLLTILDLSLLAAYCSAYGRWQEAEEKLARSPWIVTTPNKHKQAHPLLTIARQERAAYQSLSAELGLSPVSRSRTKSVGAAPPARPSSEDDQNPTSPDFGDFAGLIGRAAN